MNYDNFELIYNSLTEDCKDIVDIIGIESFLDLCKKFGGYNLYLPRFDSVFRPVRNANIFYDRELGVSYKDLVKRYKLTYRQLRRILDCK